MLKLHNLFKVYQTDEIETVALNGVNLEIEQEEFVAIMGPSGSGKSTLMHILGCLDSPSTGRYILNGAEVNELKGRALARVRNKEIQLSG